MIKRRASDRRSESFLYTRPRNAIVAAGLALIGPGCGYLGIEHGKQAAEGITQREADKLIDARNRYEALMYDCLNRRIEDNRR
ncbi:MAG: hypothetical protein ABW154_14160 [Dyella sp.]